MTLQGFRADIDQPFVRTTAVGNADRVYVGLNDFDAPDGRTATVDVSLDGGTTYAPRRIETRNTVGQNGDRKSTRLNSSHLVISYAVFCLKKKKEMSYTPTPQATDRSNDR